MSGDRHGSVHAAPGQLLAFLGGDQPHPTPHLAAHLDAANGRSAQQSHTSDQLANELFRYPTAPQSQASLLRSDNLARSTQWLRAWLAKQSAPGGLGDSAGVG